eukprot:scaffold876_cov243-Pinguiococcus_pyrenoidosus.AAC.12
MGSRSPTASGAETEASDCRSFAILFPFIRPRFSISSATLRTWRSTSSMHSAVGSDGSSSLAHVATIEVQVGIVALAVGVRSGIGLQGFLQVRHAMGDLEEEAAVGIAEDVPGVVIRHIQSHGLPSLVYALVDVLGALLDILRRHGAQQHAQLLERGLVGLQLQPTLEAMLGPGKVTALPDTVSHSVPGLRTQRIELHSPAQPVLRAFVMRIKGIQRAAANVGDGRPLGTVRALSETIEEVLDLGYKTAEHLPLLVLVSGEEVVVDLVEFRELRARHVQDLLLILHGLRALRGRLRIRSRTRLLLRKHRRFRSKQRHDVGPPCKRRESGGFERRVTDAQKVAAALFFFPAFQQWAQWADRRIVSELDDRGSRQNAQRRGVWYV